MPGRQDLVPIIIIITTSPDIERIQTCTLYVGMMS